MDKISKFLKKHWQEVFISILALFVFVSASAFNFITQKPDFWYGRGSELVKWSSPDENSNYVFTKLYAQEKTLYFFERYNSVCKDIIRPRSIRSDGGLMRPMSFLGMPIIYGKIASVTGYKTIPYITPFIAAMGVIFYYLLIKRIFGRKAALISSFLLSFFPVYLYYSSRSMFHNIPFMVFLIIGFYLLLKSNDYFNESAKNKKVKNDAFAKNYSLYILRVHAITILSGFFIGLAIITRTSEIVWLVPVFFLIAIFNLGSLNKFIPFIAGLVFALLPAMYWNQILFGGPFSSGYAEMNQTLDTIQTSGKDLVGSTLKGQISLMGEAYKRLAGTVFYFGYQPVKSWQMLNQYFVKMFYWIFWPGIIGLLWFAARFWKMNKRKFVYLLCWLASGIILVLYYGSWEFHDNPDASEHTIGNSYTRYWLPIYLGFLPFVSILILKITSFKILSRWVRAGLIALLCALPCFYSANFLLFGSSEGLIQTAYKNLATRQEYYKVIKATPGSSILITRYHDKIFFPDRKVVVGDFTDDNMIKEYAVLAKLLPVYYYNFSLPPQDLKYLKERRLPKFGLTIKKVEVVNSDFTLYKLQNIYEPDKQ